MTLLEEAPRTHVGPRAVRRGAIHEHLAVSNRHTAQLALFRRCTVQARRSPGQAQSLEHRQSADNFLAILAAECFLKVRSLPKQSHVRQGVPEALIVRLL